jgi:hypothetical protein
MTTILFFGLMFLPPGTTPATVTTSLPSQVVFASASYTDHPGAKWAGTLSFASRLPTPAGCYSYTSYDLQPTRLDGKVTVSNSTRTGVACEIPQLSRGNFHAFVLGTGGITTVNNLILGSGSVGGLAAYTLKHGFGTWLDVQNSNTTGKTARVGVLFAWRTK